MSPMPPFARRAISVLKFFGFWIVFASLTAIVVGVVVAGFLWALDKCTQTRWQHPWLLYLLPAAGLLIGWAYERFGRSVVHGNNLVIDEIHKPGAGIPLRMVPLVVAGTLVTHLFGGSAGREGTAVQVGGAIASETCRRLKLSHDHIRLLLMTGVAAGFGAVFGTPVTGTIFAIEVLTIGRLSYEAIVPCLIGAIVADRTVALVGVTHTQYAIASLGVGSAGQHVEVLLCLKSAIAGIAFGLAAMLFARLTHGISAFCKRVIPRGELRPVIGGVVVILLVWIFHTRDYLGLGVTSPAGGVSIVSSFSPNGAGDFSWLLKLLFTAITIGSGFKGGEVTPLFFIGAALGNALSRALGVPADLMAGLGFVAVFAGATNTPLACTLMAVELFGHGNGSALAAYAAIACLFAYAVSGTAGIYHSQRWGTPKP